MKSRMIFPAPWLMAGALALVSQAVSGQGNRPSSPVTVMNTPLPVNVANTPAVNANQSGVWTVSVAGTPNVQPVSSAANPVMVKVVEDPSRTTTSGRGVILVGQKYTTVSLGTPSCPAGTHFLITDVYAAPELLIGATGIDVIQLPQWGVSVPMWQYASWGALNVALNALANGPEAASASIPAGQPSIYATIPVTVLLLGNVSAPARFEFNVHVSGRCGTWFTAP